MKTAKLLPANTTPAMLELYKLLLKSEKFVNWKPDQDRPGPMRPQDPAVSADEKHFTPQQLANAWGVDVKTIRNIFRDEPGVLKISNASKLRTTLRIPKEIAERVHRRLAA
jgi:hypothetical protein